MSEDLDRAPLLDAFYHSYLTDETSAHFVANVSKHYTQGTLSQLAGRGSRTSRRAAILAIGFLGGYECNEVLGRTMKIASFACWRRTAYGKSGCAMVHRSNSIGCNPLCG